MKYQQLMKEYYVDINNLKKFLNSIETLSGLKNFLENSFKVYFLPA